jgi:hypothetical protein
MQEGEQELEGKQWPSLSEGKYVKYVVMYQQLKPQAESEV